MKKFLEQLDLSPEQVDFILEQANKFNDDRLPLVLWSNGSIDFRQLELICQWLERETAQSTIQN